MRVVIVSKALLVASYRQKLSELARLGIDVTAVVPSRWREGGSDQTLEGGTDGSYRIVQTEVRFAGHFHAHYYPDLPVIIRNLRPDLVHLDEEPYNLATFLGARTSRRSNTPSLFFTWQNIDRRYPYPVRALEHYVYQACAHALAGTNEAANVLRSKGFTSPITVVPQFGVDPDIFRPDEPIPHPFNVGFLNRLVSAKGPTVALAALSHLPPDVRMVVVGDGPMRAELVKAVHAHNLDGRVEMRGRVPSANMPALLRRLDVVILPSLTTFRWKEQFGRILIEAMACGVPVVGSDSGEIPNVIGDAGLIVPEGDALALANAIRSIQTNAGLRANLRHRGRHRVLRQFTHARIAQQTIEAYEKALAAPTRY